MLRANVGISRKVSRDYQSTGYTVNLDGEIPFTPDDADGVLEKIKELFDLAKEAINREIDRDQGEDAIGRRDEEQSTPTKNGQNGNQRPAEASPPNQTAQPKPDQRNGNQEPATNKQVQFLLTMGKRFKLSTSQLERRIADIIGRQCGVYELTKKEAGLVLDQLTNGKSGAQRQAQ